MAKIILVLVCIIAFVLRVVPPFQSVFGDGFVSFLEGDAYNRMYYATKIHEMPFATGLTYMAHNNLLFSWIVATLGHVFPIEIVGAWLPPALAVLTVFIVYAIGSLVWNQTIGLLAALFVSVIPSEFLHRSLLGFADHHVLEVFLMALTVYCFLKALKKPPLGIVEHRIFNPWYVFTGFALFLYLINWAGGFFMLGVLGLFVVIHLIRGLFSKQNIPPLFLTGIPLVVAFALYLALAGGFTDYMFWLPHNSVSGNAAAVQSANLASEMTSTIFAPISERTISEIMPLLMPGGTFNPIVVMSNLHAFVIPFLIGVYLLWRWRKDQAKLFLLVWTLAVIIATLNERRFLYYLTLNVGLLSAVVIYETAKRLRGNTKVNIALLSLPFILISLPTAINTGNLPSYRMSIEWRQALTWLKDQPDTGHVTAWSDYGHWIKYVSDKDPNLLPGPGGKKVAQLFLSADMLEATRLMDELDTAYLIADMATLKYKCAALVKISGNLQPDIRSTLIYYLSSNSPPLPFLPVVYESETIRIYKYDKR